MCECVWRGRCVGSTCNSTTLVGFFSSSTIDCSFFFSSSACSSRLCVCVCVRDGGGVPCSAAVLTIFPPRLLVFSTVSAVLMP